MATVVLGNPSAIFAGMPIPGEQITTANIPDSDPLASKLRTITHGDQHTAGIWPTHSTAPAPSWVESDDPELAAAIAEHYGCPVGRP